MTKAICSVEGCEKAVMGRGWCSAHYSRWNRHGDPLGSAPDRRVPMCTVEGCGGKYKGLGYCGKHYQRIKRLGSLETLPAKRQCLGPECTRQIDAHQGFGLCKSHYKQMLLGKALKPLLVATKNLGRPTTCTFDGCDRPHKARGYCKAHNDLLGKGQNLREIKTRRSVCCIQGCGKKHKANGYCFSHNSNLVQRWKSYGITADNGRTVWIEQGRACAICRAPAEIEALSIDHDHACCSNGRGACGRCFRGLLCTACNTGIGKLRDDPVRLRVAADYLERTSSQGR